MHCFTITRKFHARFVLSMVVAATTARMNCPPASAATFHGVGKNGRIISATADFSSAGDVLTVKITNTTPETDSVKDLLKSIDFSLNGLTPTLLSVTGVLRDIDCDGTWHDSNDALDLSWSLKSLGDGEWRLKSRPDARHAIIGPPTAEDYADASRSIRGNHGHNPFAAEMAIAEFNVPGLGAAPKPLVEVLSFGFSGSAAADGEIIPDGALEVPEPTISLLVLAGFAACLARR
jgi:hypothetical protein